MNNLSKKAITALYRFIPQAYWASYAAKSQGIELQSLSMILSYDCDTDEDIAAAQKIHDWLGERGANGVFAVPGVQLKGAKIFRQMAEEGALFINHGAAAHTELRNGRIFSVNFYDQLSLEAVETDIRLGHKIVADVIGVASVGFRAPHFGHFQQPQQLQWLYDLLKQMGYTYTSTTTPVFTQKLGPVGNINGLYEFPVTGSYYWPLRIFDSWGNLAGPDMPVVTDAYGEELKTTIRQLIHSNNPVLLNYYVDPAHVVSSQNYFAAIDEALMHGVNLLTYDDILALMRTP